MSRLLFAAALVGSSIAAPSPTVAKNAVIHAGTWIDGVSGRRRHAVSIIATVGHGTVVEPAR